MSPLVGGLVAIGFGSAAASDRLLVAVLLLLAGALALALLHRSRRQGDAEVRLAVSTARANRYERWMDAAPVELLAVNDDGRLVAWSRNAADLLDLGPPHHGAPLIRWLGAAGVPPQGPTEHRHQTTLHHGGAEREFTVQWQQLDVGWLVTLRDVTTQQQLTAATLDARHIAERLVGNQAQFVQAVAAELRTPLTALEGLHDQLSAAVQGTPAAELLDTIQATHTHLDRRLDDLLAYGPLETGTVALAEQPVALRALFESTFDLVLATHHDAKATVALHLDPRVPKAVLADPAHLGRLLRCVLDNAVRYGSPGEVRVEVLGRPSGSREVEISVRVADDGPGVSLADQARVFDPFFSRAPAHTTHAPPQIGLGLTIARELVQLMGGQIGLSSPGGRGTTVWFTLTLRAAEAPAPLPPLTDLRAVVLDDSPARQRATAELLRALGAVVRMNQQEGDDQELDVALVAQDRHPADLPDTLPRVLLRDRWQAELPGAPSLQRPLHEAELTACLADLTDWPTLAPPAEAPADDGEALRVLIVEDNLVSAAIAARTLQSLGAQTEVARGGYEALERVVHQSYDLVLMDHVLPDIDGLQTTRRIRALHVAGRRVPIVALTADDRPEHRQRCLDAGMNDFLAKPLQADALRAVLDRWTRAGSADQGWTSPAGS